MIVIARRPQVDAAIHLDRDVAIADGLLRQPFGPPRNDNRVILRPGP